MRHYAYISTGAKSAMFTLWRGRQSGDPKVDMWIRDHYVCNLAAGEAEGKTREEQEALAVQKAQDYCQRMGARMGVEMQFDGIWDEPGNARKGKLSVRDTQSLRLVEEGKFPFGKHQGTLFADAPDGYILWWADQPQGDKVVIEALRAACMGIAMERDLIAKREERRAAIREENLKSEFVGDTGQRLELEGEVVSVFLKKQEWGDDYYITKIKVGNDILVNFGRKFAERGDVIKFKATVKRHNEYQDVKTTTVNRVKVL